MILKRRGAAPRIEKTQELEKKWCGLDFGASVIVLEHQLSSEPKKNEIRRTTIECAHPGLCGISAVCVRSCEQPIELFHGRRHGMRGISMMILSPRSSCTNWRTIALR